MFKDDFKAARLAARLTAIAAAEDLGVTRGTIANWEKGRTEPDELIRARVDSWVREHSSPKPTVDPPLPALTPADQRAMEQAVADAYGHVVKVNFTEKPGRWLMTAVLSDGRIYRAERSPEGTVTVIERPGATEMESRALVHKMRAVQQLGLDPALVARRPADPPVETTATSIEAKKDASSDLTDNKPGPRLAIMLNAIAEKIEPTTKEGGFKQVGLTLTPELDTFMESEAQRLGTSKSAFTRWLLRVYREEAAGKAGVSEKREGSA